MKSLIITSTYYQDIAESMLEGAMEEAQQYDWDIQVIKVLGALDIPVALSLLLHNKRHGYNGLVTLGCVIRGETDHYHHVARCSIEYVTDLCCRYHLPVGQGILTVHNRQQALARLKTNRHVGKHAVRACHHLMQLGS